MAEYTPNRRFQLLPVNVIQHSPSDSSADSTSTDKEDVEKESEELVRQEEKESKWFDIFAGILVSTVPMILGGYVLHLIENRSSKASEE